MKKTGVVFLLFLFILLESCCFPFADCEDDSIEPLSAYEPIYMDRAAFENSVAIKDPVRIVTSGKIYVKDSFLFINELNKGFHIYDNSDPTNPKSVAFMNVPGATDLAIRSDMVYINQATDLISVVLDPATKTVSLTKRIPNTFPPLESPEGEVAYNIPENAVVVDWKPKN